jgi:hypothetical protein
MKLQTFIYSWALSLLAAYKTSNRDKRRRGEGEGGHPCIQMGAKERWGYPFIVEHPIL